MAPCPPLETVVWHDLFLGRPRSRRYPKFNIRRDIPLGEAQVYGYTGDNGVLILSNVPSNDRMRMIADGIAEPARLVWRYTGQYDSMILKASRIHGVESALVRAVIAVESAFNRYARSHKGALGLMQLMPATGRMYGVVNPYDPWQNIRAGTEHLRSLINQFGDIRLALAAYNAGATPVKRYNGIPPYRETRSYVKKVMAIYRAGSKIQIVKGDRVYSIGQPGGQARVTKFHGQTVANARPPAEVAPQSLGEVARRNQARRAAAANPPPPVVTEEAPPQEKRTPQVSANAPYYRYVDQDGVMRITRTRPSSFPYDVLEP